MKAAVLGAGNWGTTFGQVLCDAGTTTVLWTREEETADSITTSHENPKYLPEIPLPPSLTATTDPAAALDGAELVVFAVPAQTLRSCLDAGGSPFRLARCSSACSRASSLAPASG